MNQLVNCFYKYKVKDTFIPSFLNYNEVYKLIEICDSNKYILENNRGEQGIFIGNFEKCFIRSGMQEINWKNKEYKKDNKVDHPSHYTWLKDLCGIEVIDITRHMDFNLGNAIKYLLRAGHKSELGYSDKEKTIEDLKKAIFYINDTINHL